MILQQPGAGGGPALVFTEDDSGIPREGPARAALPGLPGSPARGARGSCLWGQSPTPAFPGPQLASDNRRTQETEGSADPVLPRIQTALRKGGKNSLTREATGRR